jgi:hypothetical protein
MINLVVPAIIISCLALFVGSAALIIVLAKHWSSHKIEWRPLELKAFEEGEEEESDKLAQKDDELLSDALKLQKSKKKKKIEEDPLADLLQSHNF